MRTRCAAIQAGPKSAGCGGNDRHALPRAKARYGHSGDECHDESKSEMLRVAKPFAHAQRRVGPLFVDEMGEEDFFDKKQTEENRGARSAS